MQHQELARIAQLYMIHRSPITSKVYITNIPSLRIMIGGQHGPMQWRIAPMKSNNNGLKPYQIKESQYKLKPSYMKTLKIASLLISFFTLVSICAYYASLNYFWIVAK